MAQREAQFHGRRAYMNRFVAVLAGGCIGLFACSGFAPPYDVPLAPDSPWPKFRHDAPQTGRSALKPKRGGLFWSYPTGKGIFSTPVVGGDGTIYVGSADRYFYALTPAGELRWRHLTGDIVDSAGLLDDLGRVYFGSGDGKLRALDAATGQPVWEFLADAPEINGAFINWFEGNVAMAANGDLIVPNDNYFVYRIDRHSGDPIWKFRVPEQTWSSPAIDSTTGRIFFGNNNVIAALGNNFFALDGGGEKIWSELTLGTIAASPLLSQGMAIVAGFDGYVRAYGKNDGREIWTFAARDHVYASAAQLSDGTLVVPAADGTVYALDARTGSAIWAFDTEEAIRSSPAIDGNDTIYVGSGAGKLYVLNPDGSLRWTLRLIDADRNDLNASPALGTHAIYIAGENGQIFSVPYDYCLSPEQTENIDCTIGGGEALPDEGAGVYFTSQFGNLMPSAPSAIDANAILAFSLNVRQAGDTRLALFDASTLQVSVEPEAPFDVRLSGDRKFLTVAPQSTYAADANGKIRIDISGDFLSNPRRHGLRFEGGELGGSFASGFEFTLTPPGAEILPLVYPAAPGDAQSVWEISRIAVPLPTVLPSYNQIGFDSLHFLIGLVRAPTAAGRGVAWLVGAKLADDDNDTVVDPETGVMFPLTVSYEAGLLSLASRGRLDLEILNADIRFDTFRIAGRIGAGGRAHVSPALEATLTCAGLGFFAPFLRDLGFCNPDDDLMVAYGALDLDPYAFGSGSPSTMGQVSWLGDLGRIEARFAATNLRADRHSFGILLLDPSDGLPLSLDYGRATHKNVTTDGLVDVVRLEFSPERVPETVEAILLVDTAPLAMTMLTLPSVD